MNIIMELTSSSTINDNENDAAINSINRSYRNDGIKKVSTADFVSLISQNTGKKTCHVRVEQQE